MQMTKSLTDREQIFNSMLSLLIKLNGSMKVIDLGCGHCLFLRAAMRAGCIGKGIDARLDRVPEDMKLFVHKEDVRNVVLTDYDLILCLGIFYHMTLKDQLTLIEKFEGKPVILDTHYCSNETRVTVDGYTGCFFQEGTALTSSFGNPESFWPTEPELIRMVGKRHDVLKWLPEHHPGRSFYLLMPR